MFRTASGTTGEPNCNVKTPMILDETKDNQLMYTYSVGWMVSSNQHPFDATQLDFAPLELRAHTSRSLSLLPCVPSHSLQQSNIPWGLRWDNYLHVFDPRIHWFSIVNSLVIVIFLCVMVAMILLRTVSRDISRYNAIDLSVRTYAKRGTRKEGEGRETKNVELTPVFLFWGVGVRRKTSRKIGDGNSFTERFSDLLLIRCFFR